MNNEVLHLVLVLLTLLFLLFALHWITNQYRIPSAWLANKLIKWFKVKEPRYLLWLKGRIDSYEYPITLNTFVYEFIPKVYIYFYLKEITSYEYNKKIKLLYKDLLWISKWVGDHNNKIR